MASSSKSAGPYDVFLSFRGTDVRNSFASHLYNALYRNGIHTFRDDEELRKGQDISMLLETIEESRIAIIVFSENYTFSWWCLEEVAKIMECKEQKGLTVLPVFYKVDPKEVRGGRASYARGLAKHVSKHGKDSEEMKRWKKALLDAGSLSGWPLNDRDDESKVIQDIVKDISTRLSKTPFVVAEHPVGIESRVAEVKSMLNLESKDDVLMVGLWGQGGIGKTTLGRAIYNDIFKKFDGSSFLANVRERSMDCMGLVTLQEQLLKETLLLPERLVVSNVAGGKSLIPYRLRRKRVLVILDDVDDEDQLCALAGKANWFCNGSRILVTTRDRHLLTRTVDRDRVDVYEVKGLEHGEACELLSKHAFPTYEKLESKIDLLDGFLNHAKGLPLALEVLGSLLRGTTEDVWESILEKLSEAPNEKINNVLKVSYDKLEKNEKEIFLYIACFFRWRGRKYTMEVLDSCGLKTPAGFDTLIKRSLISIEYGSLKMHDLIQAMGIDIVNQECQDPKGRSKLWLYDDVCNVLQDDEGDCAIEAIVLEPSKLKELSIHPKAFTKMRRLKLLILRNVHNSFQGPIWLRNELRWIEWDGRGPWDPHFSSGEKKLVRLDMRNGSITGLVKQFKGFQQLKRLSLMDCISMVSTPDFSCTPNLEELRLRNCKNLIEAHESIAYHDKLRVLNISKCSELSVFPNVLKSKNLRCLEIFDCPKFERFPDIPCKLERLEDLYLSCTAIKELPTSIENLCSLESMDLYCLDLVSLPASIYKLQNLCSLTIRECTNFIGLPKYEDSADGRMMIGLPLLYHLSLDKCNLSKVEFLEDLSCFPSLKVLNLSWNGITRLPPSVSKRDHLFELSLDGCHQLQEISELPPSLTTFRAVGCESLQTVGRLVSDHWVRQVLTGHSSLAKYGQFRQRYFSRFSFPGGEMPEWIQPVEERTISFMASQDLYDKFLGLVFCAVVNTGKGKFGSIGVESHFNGKSGGKEDIRPFSCDYKSWNLDHNWLQYSYSFGLRKVVDFGHVDGRYAQFSFTLYGDDDRVKKWGVRILCKQLEDDLKVEIRDNQLIDPDFLHEVDYGSTYSEAKSSHKHEDDPMETDQQQNFQDCEMNAEEHGQEHGQEHSQMGSKRKHELILPLGKRIKTMFTSIFDRWRPAS